jgi:hypothetical protein
VTHGTIAILVLAAKLIFLEVDRRIEAAVHQRVKMAAFSELLTQFNEFKDEVNRSGVLAASRRKR